MSLAIDVERGCRDRRLRSELCIRLKGMSVLMIELHRLQNQRIIVNADLIEFIESTPDTMISTTTGKKMMVLESVEEVIDKIILYKRHVLGIAKKKARKNKSKKL
jgi:flagellar protein FlbD